MNNVTLIGNLCRDFELRNTANGGSIASNTIAVRQDRKQPDGKYLSDFFDIYCFGQQADYAVRWLRKGDKVCVAGSVHIRDYTMKNGTKGRAVEVSVNSIENLEKISGDPQQEAVEETTEVGIEPPAQPAQPKEQPQQQATQAAAGDPLAEVIDNLPDDDLPF